MSHTHSIPRSANKVSNVDRPERSTVDQPTTHPYPPAVQWHRWSQQPALLIDRWESLIDRIKPGKAYLSPQFVRPALGFLEPHQDPFIASIDDGENDGPSLVALLQPVAMSPRVPFPHLRAFKSVHSFMTGLIVDSTNPTATVAQLFDSTRERGYGGIEMLYRLVDTPSWQWILAGARQAGFEWVEYRHFHRAIIHTADPYKLETSLTSKRRKAFRHAMRGLEAIGPVEYVVISDPKELIEAARRFLDIEDTGWKHERGVSLRSQATHERFFSEMFAAFALAGQARICELRVDKRTVASTVHLISTDTSFAFKLGWDPHFARYKVGICLQVLTALHAQRDFGDVAVIDSCTEDDSFFEKLWPGRRQIASGIFVRQGLRERIVTGLKSVRQLRQLLPMQSKPSHLDGDPCGH